jgi:hypothetical protein
MHQQDFTLARSQPADKLVLVRDVFTRAIDHAAEDSTGHSFGRTWCPHPNGLHRAILRAVERDAFQVV